MLLSPAFSYPAAVPYGSLRHPLERDQMKKPTHGEGDKPPGRVSEAFLALPIQPSHPCQDGP